MIKEFFDLRMWFNGILVIYLAHSLFGWGVCFFVITGIWILGDSITSVIERHRNLKK